MRWLLIALAAAMAAFMVSRLVNSQTLNLNYFFPLVAAPALDA
jgi:anaerobic C4-dicarboxylate transporter